MTPNSTSSPREKRSDGLVISRRAFLGVSAGVAAAVAAGYVIKRSEINFLLEPQESTEGVLTEKWVATSCLNCPTRCAIKVRVVNGKAVWIAGNTKSTYSDGKTCPRSHIGLQVLYDPDRITSPLKRTNQQKGRDKDPGWEPIGWGEALSEIKEELEKRATTPEKVLLIQGLNTSSDEDLIRRLAKAYGTPNLVAEDTLETGADREGKRIADGRNNSGYDLESTNYILAFGANILESERPLARNLRMWGKIRRERPNRAKIVVIDPRYSLTAAKADEWIPINPGTEGALAMSIANVIVSEGLYDDADFINNWTSGFNNYRNLVLSNDFSPESVAEITGVSADTIRRLAREFAQSKPAIAWSGAGATNWPHGSYASHAIYCLNALVGSIDVPGGIVYQESPPYRDMPAITGNEPGIGFHQAADLIWNNNVEIVMGFNSNLVMSVPDTSRWDEALATMPYYVHIAPSLTEMANYADIVLPACTYLEEWAYESSPPGSGFAEAKIKQPVVEPWQDSRPIAQIIFTLANQLGGKVKNAFENIGDPEEFVKHRTDAFVSWDTFEADGVWKGQDYQYRKYDQIFHTPSKKFEFHSANLDKLLKVEFLGENSEDSLKLITYRPVLDIMNGNQNYPWAQEIFLVMHGYGWANFVEINSDTARKLGIKDGDTVRVASEFSEIKARARVFEGILPGVVAIASGQGHYSCGRWANGIGVNPNEIIGVDYDDESGQPSFFNTRVRVYKA